ncbi:hypothetical protein NQ176_g6456 [Zarea fungicola]|uniref:Uncharacterized protein n=1 Tax=Zarea fungicola TaxID=93591 RepID=A0ACC1N5K5_9HYPO|nr:hypothetical protein NQ176_g6456 [Lecanicillium fungicola]
MIKWKPNAEDNFNLQGAVPAIHSRFWAGTSNGKKSRTPSAHITSTHRTVKVVHYNGSEERALHHRENRRMHELEADPTPVSVTSTSIKNQQFLHGATDGSKTRYTKSEDCSNDAQLHKQRLWAVAGECPGRESRRSPATESPTSKESLGPKIWTRTAFFRPSKQAAEVISEGLYYPGSTAALTDKKPKKKWVCDAPRCSKSFVEKTHLEIHRRTHTGAAKPYVCLKVGCGLAFAQRGNLKKHLRRHTGERSFCCRSCGKTFAKRDNVRLHEETHKLIKRL